MVLRERAGHGAADGTEDAVAHLVAAVGTGRATGEGAVNLTSKPTGLKASMKTGLREWPFDYH